MLLPHSENLPIGQLSALFLNTSNSYKFFWFQAILNLTKEGKDVFTYEELIDEMIADAWYMVCEYHLNLGPNDALEKAVNRLREISGMKPAENRTVILAYLKSSAQREIASAKKTLIQNVPYRLLAPFVPDIKGKAWDIRKEQLIQQMNMTERLLYCFDHYNGLHTTIRIHRDWMSYLHQNQEIVRGWLRYQMIVYLQKRNPSVPGIADKLFPPQERKLERVRKYWKMILKLHPVCEIYAKEELSAQNISIDHFVPWSYVAHDELWNLHPTTLHINRKKSNRLPDWDAYFSKLCQLQYFSYQMMWQHGQIQDEFDKCAKEHLNNMEVRYGLYREGLDYTSFSNTLSGIMLPVYQSAKNSGFGSWSGPQ